MSPFPFLVWLVSPSGEAPIGHFTTRRERALPGRPPRPAGHAARQAAFSDNAYARQSRRERRFGSTVNGWSCPRTGTSGPRQVDRLGGMLYVRTSRRRWPRCHIPGRTRSRRCWQPPSWSSTSVTCGRWDPVRRGRARHGRRRVGAQLRQPPHRRPPRVPASTPRHGREHRVPGARLRRRCWPPRTQSSSRCSSRRRSSCGSPRPTSAPTASTPAACSPRTDIPGTSTT